MAQQPIGVDALLNNVQGDVLVGMPKKTQLFFFFTIDNARIYDFRAQLGKLIPLITTGAVVRRDRAKITQHKNTRAPGFTPVAETNIAFSHYGLTKLGFNKNANDKIHDDVFDKGMQADIGNLGDNIKNWIPEFKRAIDGVILVSGDSHDRIFQGINGVKVILGKTIREVFTVRGDSRPGDLSGHEHFGFADGISEPAIAGFNTSPLPGQDTIPQGIILLGRDQDPEPSRPAWAKDGSFMCFRMLAQRVPEFDAFTTDNAIRINDPSAPKNLGKELLGARMVGRWKSGAPVDITPYNDDTYLATDPKRNNAFTFANDTDPPARCPFAAHIRKTNPRSDLAKDPDSKKKFLDPHRILRRGITFGPEVTNEERYSKTTKQNRGLLFVCYQSKLAEGFQFIQQSWANSPGFIFGKSQQPGFDPIIGQNTDDTARTTAGMDKNNPSGAPLSLGIKEWVTSLGGEYFFTPSIKGLKSLAGVA